VPALYLSLTLEGMLLEMGHGFAHRFDPLTICSYQVDVDDIVDLRTKRARKAAEVEFADMACAWALDLANGHEPASWAIAKRLIANGAAGILAPSFASGARSGRHNLAVWRWGPELPHRVVVHDPDHRLPRDQASWR
jgi:RES domain-containing protein